MSDHLQQRFAAALLDPERPLPAPLTSYTGKPPVRRFAVYRNNVVVALVEALAARFPVTQRLVGEEFFRAMARMFVAAQPPRSPILMQYGDAFPGFVATFEPAAEVPYLADVARLEAARTRAYHAADQAPVALSLLQSIPPEAIGAIRLRPHPSAEIVRSPHPIVTIWAMHAGGGEPGPIDDWRGEDALVARPKSEVEVRKLPPGGATFLTALFAGKPLAAAIAEAMEEHAEFDTVANLAALISAGAACEASW